MQNRLSSSGSHQERIPVLRHLFRIILKVIPNRFVYVLSEELNKKNAEFFRHKIKKIGNNVTIEHGVVIISPGCLSLGDNCMLNHYVHILASAGVVLEEGVWIANHASLVSHSHPADVEYIGDHEPVEKPIYIEKHAWIGTHAVILPGVRLGRSCVVAAGAVVTRDVPPYAIVAGVPARVVRYKQIAEEEERAVL